MPWQGQEEVQEGEEEGQGKEEEEGVYLHKNVIDLAEASLQQLAVPAQIKFPGQKEEKRQEER